MRRISAAIRDRDDLRDTVSHETVGAMLRGSGLPKWVKVECVVRQLAEWAVTGLNADDEVRRFHKLWLAASDEPDPTVVVPAPVIRDFVAPRPTPATSDPHSVADEQAPPAGPTMTNAPPPSAHFTGRRSTLTAIRQALVDQQAPPLSLVGLGGVGKTQLAVEYAHRWANEYDVIWWVPAEQSSQAIAALAALSGRLGIPDAVDMRQTIRGLLTALENSALRWLIVYDNADVPDDLDSLMPAAGGHVLVTSRNSAWETATRSLRVDVFSRQESVNFLRARGVAGSTADSNALAEQLGDLPLALDQVCAMQTATGMPVSEYLRLFAEHFADLLAAGRRAGARTTTVTAFVNVAFGRLRAESPVAAQLLELLAFMAPSPIPLGLLHRGRDGQLTPPLGRALYRPEELARIAGLLARYGLAQVLTEIQAIQVHRLVQLVVREGMDPAPAGTRRQDVHRLLAAADPGQPDDERHWAQHADIGPHLITSDAVHATDGAARTAVLHQIRYLERVGDFEASAQLARTAVDAWRISPEEGGLGHDHDQTIQATRHLANAIRSLGSYRESREMIFETLALLRDSPRYGQDHPLMLDTAAVAAFYLRFDGAYAEAMKVDSACVESMKRLFGPDDPRTLEQTSNLTINLRLAGDAAQALEIDTRLEQSLSAAATPTDPRRLVAVRNRARDLLDLGRFAEALTLQTQWRPSRRRADDLTLATRTISVAQRRLGRYQEALETATENYRACQDRFGPDNHLTLAAIMTYANTLRAVGDTIGARSLATEALDRYRRLFGEQNPLTLAAATNLAVILRALGQWREAYGVDEVTFDETVRVLGPEHPHALVTAIGLATDLARHHSGKDAVALGRSSLEGFLRVRGESHPETWACAANLALDLGDAGLRQRALDRLSALLGADHPEVRAAFAGGRLEGDIEPPPT